jgi:TPR repeat protein
LKSGLAVWYEKAYECWRKLAEEGNIHACEALGEMYRDGLSVKQDYEKAADLFWKSWTAGGEAEGYDEGKVNYDKLIEEGKIPADYAPKEVTFEEK